MGRAILGRESRDRPDCDHERQQQPGHQQPAGPETLLRTVAGKPRSSPRAARMPRNAKESSPVEFPVGDHGCQPGPHQTAAFDADGQWRLANHPSVRAPARMTTMLLDHENYVVDADFRALGLMRGHATPTLGIAQHR